MGSKLRIVIYHRWSSLSVQVSTAQMLPNLAAIQTDMRRLATNLDIKLQAIEELSKTSDKEAQSRKVTNLKNCVRSAATVLSSASTVASMHEQDPSQVIDDHMSEIESVWIQPEALEATRSWVSKQAKDSSWEDWSEELTTAEDNTKDEDSMRANAASNTLALGAWSSPRYWRKIALILRNRESWAGSKQSVSRKCSWNHNLGKWYRNPTSRITLPMVDQIRRTIS